MLRQLTSQKHVAFQDKENAPNYFKTPGIKQHSENIGKNGKTPFQVYTPLVQKNVGLNTNTRQPNLLKETATVKTNKSLQTAPRTALQNITNKTTHGSSNSSFEKPITAKKSFTRESAKKKLPQREAIQIPIAPGNFSKNIIESKACSKENEIYSEKKEACLKEKDEIYEIEYAPPVQEEQPWDPGFTVDFTPLSGVLNPDTYEYAHLVHMIDHDELPPCQLESIERNYSDPLDEYLQLSAIDTNVYDSTDDIILNIFEDFQFDI